MNWECSPLHMEAYRQERQKFPVIARAQSLYTSFLSFPRYNADRDAEWDALVVIVSQQ